MKLDSKSPTTSKRTSLGDGPSGVGAPPSGEISTTSSPISASTRLARLTPCGPRAGARVFGRAFQGLQIPRDQLVGDARDAGQRCRPRCPAAESARSPSARAAPCRWLRRTDSRRYALDPAQLFEQRGVVDDVAVVAAHDDVRVVADDLVTPRALEPVHDRQHGNDQPHPRRHGSDADQRDDRDEDLTPLGDQVAQRDEPLGPSPDLDEPRRGQRQKSEDDAGRESLQCACCQLRGRRRLAE